MINIDGHTFNSVAESERWKILKLMQRSRLITNLKRQVKYVLIDKSQYGNKVFYIADFVYYKDNKLVVEDVNSAIAKDLPLFELKKRLFAEKYGFEITIVE